MLQHSRHSLARRAKLEIASWEIDARHRLGGQHRTASATAIPFTAIANDKRRSSRAPHPARSTTASLRATRLDLPPRCNSRSTDSAACLRESRDDKTDRESSSHCRRRDHQMRRLSIRHRRRSRSEFSRSHPRVESTVEQAARLFVFLFSRSTWQANRLPYEKFTAFPSL